MDLPKFGHPITNPRSPRLRQRNTAGHRGARAASPRDVLGVDRVPAGAGEQRPRPVQPAGRAVQVGLADAERAQGLEDADDRRRPRAARVEDRVGAEGGVRDLDVTDLALIICAPNISTASI